MVLMILAQAGAPDRIGRIAKLEQALSDIGRDLGVPSQYVVTADEREAMDKQEQEAALAAAAAAAAMSGAAPGAAPGMEGMPA
jgi:hypothetical protein